MADGDMELLEQMRRRRSGWGEEDFDRLYRRFGFREITRPRAPHRVYVHPEFPYRCLVYQRLTPLVV